MYKLYCLDRYTNKNIALETTRPLADFKANDRIVYQSKIDNKQSLAIYLGYEAPASIDRAGELLDHLSDDDKKYFDEMQAKAAEKYILFKKKFRAEFPTARPVVARYHIFAEQYYFYFFGEERYSFSDFVRRFREELGHGFFLFQIGARDMIKLSPATDGIIGCNGICLCCKSNRPLPNIEIEILMEQHLEGRDIERLKGRCGKLKCSLMYEVELYVEENKKYPPRGEFVESSCGTCGTVTSFNIMTGMVQMKDAEGTFFSFNVSEVKKKWQEKKHDEGKQVDTINRTTGRIGSPKSFVRSSSRPSQKLSIPQSVRVDKLVSAPSSVHTATPPIITPAIPPVVHHVTPAIVSNGGSIGHHSPTTPPSVGPTSVSHTVPTKKREPRRKILPKN